MQSIARLAEVYLEVGRSHGPVERFRASTLLAQFVEMQLPSGRRNQLWLGEHTWPPERIEALITAAQKWLCRIPWRSA